MVSELLYNSSMDIGAYSLGLNGNELVDLDLRGGPPGQLRYIEDPRQPWVGILLRVGVGFTVTPQGYECRATSYTACVSRSECWSML